MIYLNRNIIFFLLGAFILFSCLFSCQDREFFNNEGVISRIDCQSITTSENLIISGQSVQNIKIFVPYLGGNSGFFNSYVIQSEGVTGLTATLEAGRLTNGSGNFTFNLSGTPSSSGIAAFRFLIGGHLCLFSFAVSSKIENFYQSNSIFCESGPTEIKEVVNPKTGKVWMDRNLGAKRVALKIDDSEAFGDLYQWGRRSDGHQCRTSSTSTSQSNSDQPVHSYFIKSSINPYDWLIEQNNNLWQGTSGINNPCPKGFRLPTDSEFEEERKTWSTESSTGAFDSFLKLTPGGARSYSNGAIYNVNVFGYYWTSSVYYSRSQKLILNSSGSLVNEDIRASGFSIRCIKD